jgi:hypothetical protein
MGRPFEYEIPSAAGGDEGIEGFSVEAGGERVGRVAALNRTLDGLTLIVDSGDAYRPLPVRLVSAIDVGTEWVTLSPEGEAALAAAPAVTPTHRGAEGPHLVRHVPRELGPLVTATRPRRRRRRSRLWPLAGGLVLLAGFSILPVNLLIEHEVGGALRWAWLAVPALLLALAAWAALAAIDRDSPRAVPLREKLADAPSILFGVSPRTRKRG